MSEGRKRIAIPPGLPYFKHPVLAKADFVVDEGAPVSALIATCESPYGQTVCSCGYFALAWDASGIETLYT